MHHFLNALFYFPIFSRVLKEVIAKKVWKVIREARNVNRKRNENQEWPGTPTSKIHMSSKVEQNSQVTILQRLKE